MVFCLTSEKATKLPDLDQTGPSAQSVPLARISTLASLGRRASRAGSRRSMVPSVPVAGTGILGGLVSLEMAGGVVDWQASARKRGRRMADRAKWLGFM